MKPVSILELILSMSVWWLPVKISKNKLKYVKTNMWNK